MCGGACVVLPFAGAKYKDLFGSLLLIAQITYYTRLFLRFSFAFCHGQRMLKHLCQAKQATLERREITHS
jgi:hypothetical protein